VYGSTLEQVEDSTAKYSFVTVEHETKVLSGVYHDLESDLQYRLRVEFEANSTTSGSWLVSKISADDSETEGDEPGYPPLLELLFKFSFKPSLASIHIATGRTFAASSDSSSVGSVSEEESKEPTKVTVAKEEESTELATVDASARSDGWYQLAVTSSDSFMLTLSLTKKSPSQLTTLVISKGSTDKNEKDEGKSFLARWGPMIGIGLFMLAKTFFMGNKTRRQRSSRQFPQRKGHGLRSSTGMGMGQAFDGIGDGLSALAAQPGVVPPATVDDMPNSSMTEKKTN